MLIFYILFLWESGLFFLVGNFFELNNNYNDVICFEEKGVIGNEVRYELFVIINIFDFFKIKVVVSGIKV